MSPRWQDEPGKFINRDDLLNKLQDLYNSIDLEHGYTIGQILGRQDTVAQAMKMVLEAPSEPKDMHVMSYNFHPKPYASLELRKCEEWHGDDLDYSHGTQYGDKFELLPLRARVSVLDKAWGGSIFVEKGALLGVEPHLREIIKSFMEDIARFGYRNFVDGAEGN